MKWLTAAIIGVSTLTPGCSAKKPAYEPSAEAEAEYQRLSEAEAKYQTLCEQVEEIVAIEASDLGVPPTAITEVGRKILATEPSKDRFPAGLSVVRVEAATRGDEPEHFLQIVPVEDYRNARWIRATQDLATLREITMLDTYGIDQRGTDWQALLRRSLRADCDLCLIYAQVHDTDADAEFVGVLWDAVTEEALATFRAPVVLPPDVRLTYEEKQRYAELTSEAEHQAMAELRRLVRDAIWDIAANDTQGTTIQPSPWQKELPLYPRDSHRDVRIYMNERPRK